MKARSLENWFCLGGVLALIFYFLHVFIGQAGYPGYNWVAQAVSDLTAADSPVQKIVSPYSSLYGMFACMGCLFVCLVVRSRLNRPFRLGVYLFTVMNFVSTIGYALFPLSGAGYQGQFQDVMHLFVVTGGVVLLSIVSLVLIGVGGARNGGSKFMAVCSFIALASMFFGSIGMGAFPKEFFGLLERFSVFSVVIFTGILGILGFALAD